MAATRGQRVKSDDEDSDVSEVYEFPVPTRCRIAATPFCRYVPFLPCYRDPDIIGILRQMLGRICRCCRPTSKGS